jgi:predicted phosphodiesterase
VLTCARPRAIVARMSIAALYDIHGNLPALEAVLKDARQLGVDRIVVGGDVLPGPMPLATVDCLLRQEVPVRFLHGNGELAVLAEAVATDDPGTVTYWGTVSGEPLPEPLRRVVRWTAQQLRPQDARLLRSWPSTLRLDIGELGRVLFCHATPRSEVECFTRLTPEHLLIPVFAGLGIDVVVCGHTHMQFDRVVGRVRVVNAGSVGMPFQQPGGAFWLLLGPDVQLRHTEYDLTAAADQVRTTRYPQAEEFAARYILDPPPEAEMLDAFTAVSFR